MAQQRVLIIIGGLVILVVAGFLLYWQSQPSELGDIVIDTENQNYVQQQEESSKQLSIADIAGLSLSNNRCTGTEKPKLIHLPMDKEDFSMILPYGLMVGGHVTPIDHQYFSPQDFNSPRDAYEVYAMADARIVDIGTRPRTDKNGNPFEEYRIVFSMSCRLFYYYDLVTSLAPDLTAAYEAQGNRIDFPVKAGQLIGRIGGQTLDFAVWDTEKPLTGFVVPEHYKGEGWKIYTADPLDYYTEDLKKEALEKYIRTAEPRSGKIDHDIDGKLIGNWFQQKEDGTTDGYAGGGGSPDYWITHLAFAPDYIDPSGFVISIGNWPDENNKQFTTPLLAPSPASVDVAMGLVKYDLVQVQYKVKDAFWDRFSLQRPITFVPGIEILGCLLVEMKDARTIKVEARQNTSCRSLSGFSDNSITYIR